MDLRDDWPDLLADMTTELDACSGYVVTVTDPLTDEVDAYGPFTADVAVGEAERILGDLHGLGLRDVVVRMVRLHAPESDVGRAG
jgi:hypothetical protein